MGFLSIVSQYSTRVKHLTLNFYYKIGKLEPTNSSHIFQRNILRLNLGKTVCGAAEDIVHFLLNRIFCYIFSLNLDWTLFDLLIFSGECVIIYIEDEKGE